MTSRKNTPTPNGFDCILLAWNGSREATRAAAEAMPYLLKAEAVDVVIVQDPDPAPQINAVDLVKHLQHHDVLDHGSLRGHRCMVKPACH